MQIADVNLDEVSEYFNSLPELLGNDVNVNLGILLNEIYLENNLYYARRGLFCYDRVDDSMNEDANYQLLAWPSIFLNISDIPSFILSKLAKCREGFGFINQGEVDMSTIF
ncbi:hypothetical protein [Chitinophaga polysaccharea]|uniref:hypothetical protein n=1 Tax=Chitinophaga polysaccharea TaxID=1293035 RepID=UPI0011A2DB36|nr:hypothetical protein [Chitinophaga polysaccharea]